MKNPFLLFVLLSGLLPWLTTPLAAQPTQEIVTQQETVAPDLSEARAWPDWDTATGNWGGARTFLEDRGLEIFGGYTAEVWGNTTGGITPGAVYTGLFDFGVNLDLEKASGWQGASMNTTWLWISGQDASANLVGNFLTISNIAAFQTLRMMELWFQQNLFDDTLSLRSNHGRFGICHLRLRRHLHQRHLRLARFSLSKPPRRRSRVSHGHPRRTARVSSDRLVHVPVRSFSGQCL